MLALSAVQRCNKNVIGVCMDRLVLRNLVEWKASPYRKPLILKGVRQVGKTWVLKEFGRRCYENTAYFNFDENNEYRQFFETTKDVDRILQNLMLASGQKILPEKTLIIFDEVQLKVARNPRLCEAGRNSGLIGKRVVFPDLLNRAK